MHTGLALLLETINLPESTPEAGLQYHVRPVPNFERHYFGLTSMGAPCLLLSAKDDTLKAPIRLAALEISFAIPCTVAVAGDTERTETLTAITCTASDRVVQGYFAHVCETILHIVGPSPSIEQLVEAVRRLVDLFQRLSAPPQRSVIGLFGELYVISVAHSTAATVAAWRSKIDDRFDFSIDDVRLEVKASSTRQRAHEFSLEQCSPPPSTDGILISLFIETSGGGTSLLDLIDRIKTRLENDADLLLKLQATVAEGLGDNLSAALSIRFDESLAKSSLRVYELTSIPAIRGKLPPGVSQVRFRSDLSHTPVADPTVLKSRNRQLESLLPK